ncbi:hypothetical protein MHTCC0001_14810 [Flavobacteriaceae bacterium MHTCC 0001]
MVILKKINASTLMETLVASVLIIIVFVVSSMILNNVFSNQVNNDTSDIQAYLNELEYLYKTEKIAVPFDDDFGNWEVSIDNNQGSGTISVNATHTDTGKTLSNKIYAIP